MNECLFFSHIVLVIACVLGSIRLGKQALISLVILQGVFANLFVVKQMHLFCFDVTCSDVFAIGSVLALNFLQEIYGKEESNRAVKMACYGLLFFTAMGQIHLWYKPLSSDTTHSSFVSILSSSPRITFASIGVYFLVQKIDVRLFGFLKERWAGRHLALRITCSLLATQLLDTVLFSFLGLYGLVFSVADVILMSFLIKAVIIVSSGFLVMLGKRYVPV